MILVILEAKMDKVKISTEIFLIVSYLIREESVEPRVVPLMEKLASLIRQILNYHKNDSESLSLIAESIANLPIEDLNIII